MREYKFRAWEKNTKKMYDRVLAGNGDPCSIVWDCDRKDWLHFDECSGYIMQYTGLKDIYNKEIYEGDILNVDKNYSGSYTPTYVLFYKGTFMVQVVHKMNAPFPLADNVGIYEIIGNIYENAELLEY